MGLLKVVRRTEGISTTAVIAALLKGTVETIVEGARKIMQ